MNCSVYAAFMIWKGTDETMVDIQCKDGKYIIDARIHSEVDTNDIAKVQERFTSDCAYEFAEAMREAVNVSHLVMIEQRKEVTK